MLVVVRKSEEETLAYTPVCWIWILSFQLGCRPVVLLNRPQYRFSFPPSTLPWLKFVSSGCPGSMSFFSNNSDPWDSCRHRIIRYLTCSFTLLFLPKWFIFSFTVWIRCYWKILSFNTTMILVMLKYLFCYPWKQCIFVFPGYLWDMYFTLYIFWHDIV